MEEIFCFTVVTTLFGCDFSLHMLLSLVECISCADLFSTIKDAEKSCMLRLSNESYRIIFVDGSV